MTMGLNTGDTCILFVPLQHKTEPSGGGGGGGVHGDGMRMLCMH